MVEKIREDPSCSAEEGAWTFSGSMNADCHVMSSRISSEVEDLVSYAAMVS